MNRTRVNKVMLRLRLGREAVERLLRHDVRQALSAMRSLSAGRSWALGLPRDLAHDAREYLRREVAGADRHQSGGVGPVTLDYAMARRHGWTEPECAYAFLLLAEMSRVLRASARRRHPERYGVGKDGTVIYIGPDADGRSLKLRKGRR